MLKPLWFHVWDKRLESNSHLRRRRVFFRFVAAFVVVPKVERTQKLLWERHNTITSGGFPGCDKSQTDCCAGRTLLKEETLCSSGLRLFAVAAAVSCAVRACNCTTRPASKAWSRDGWGFCCCICRLCTSCCNYKQTKTKPKPHCFNNLKTLQTFKGQMTVSTTLTCWPWGLCRSWATAAMVSVLVIWEAQSGRPWTKFAGVAGVAGVPGWYTDTKDSISHRAEL